MRHLGTAVLAATLLLAAGCGAGGTAGEVDGATALTWNEAAWNDSTWGGEE